MSRKKPTVQSTPPTFLQDVASAINRHSQENASNTPDFILAEFLERCLGAWNDAVHQREKWYGRDGAATASSTAPAAPQGVCEVIQGMALDPSRTACGKPAVLRYEAHGGGYMHLCAEHGARHVAYCERWGPLGWVPREQAVAKDGVKPVG